MVACHINGCSGPDWVVWAALAIIGLLMLFPIVGLILVHKDGKAMKRAAQRAAQRRQPSPRGDATP